MPENKIIPHFNHLKFSLNYIPVYIWKPLISPCNISSKMCESM